MNTQLTDQQIEFYGQNGFLVIDEFLVDTELASWRQAVDEAVAQRVGRNGTYHHQRGEDDYYKNVFVQCVNLWQTSEKIKQLLLDPQLGRLAADLAGVKGIRLYHDHALVKQAWANPTNFHVDNPYDPFYSHQAIMLWITQLFRMAACIFCPAPIRPVSLRLAETSDRWELANCSANIHSGWRLTR